MRKNRKAGFTLIELLVVISVIGILAALIMVNFNAARERARDVQRKSDLDQVKKALRMYYNDQNPTSYPPNGALSWGNPFESTEVIYMKLLPEDPTPGESYNYSQNPTKQDFCLYATLENKSDTDISRSQARCSGCAVGDTSTDYVVCAD